MSFNPKDYRNRIGLSAGDFSTELFSKGLRRSTLLERANLDHAEWISEVGLMFLDAGAEILVTLTDHANVIALGDRVDAGELTPEQIMEINRQGAKMCRFAADHRAGSAGVVLGAIGPVEPLLTLNEIDEKVLSAAYQTQARSLAEGGVDAIVCRSFAELQALSLAIRAATESTGLPVIGSLIFDCGWEHQETAMGVTVPQACEAMVELGAVMVGCDRADNPDHAASIASLMRSSCDLPLWMEINAGRAELHEGQVNYPETPEDFGQRFRPIADAGAHVIGGGLGVTAGHIAALLDAHDKAIRRSKRRS